MSAVAQAVDGRIASAFLEALTGSPDTPVTFQTFDDNSTRKNRSLVATLHGTLVGCLPELERLNASGAGIFVTVNETDGHGRKAENIIALRALFVDKDNGPLPEVLALAPSFRVRTIQGEHAYWLLKEGEHRDDFRPAQKQLIRVLDTDDCVHDLPRVMRLPGFVHRKGAPTLIDGLVIGDVSKRYTIAEVTRAFPFLRLAKPNEKPRKSPRERFDEAVARLALTTENRNDALFRTARVGRDLIRQGALTRDEVEDACIDACVRNGYADEKETKLVSTLESALSDSGAHWEAGLMCNDKGVPAANVGNACLILANHPAWEGVLALDVRNAEVFFRSEPPWVQAITGGDFPRACEDGDETLCATWFSKFQRMGIAGHVAQAAMLAIAKREPFDPVVDYLDSVKWDGVPRAETWLMDHAQASDAPEAYLRAVAKRWLIAAVARAMSPGCQADSMLILEGTQEAGKTSLGRVMGGPFFAGGPPKDVSGQKMQEFIRGPWIIEFGELSSFKKAEAEDVKTFLTNLVDRYRPAYGHVIGTFPRRCVFMGSTNRTHYFSDATGNRRFWPVRCGTIDVAALRLIRDQLWAEAVALYDAGEPWELTPAEKTLAKEQQADRLIVDSLEDKIARALETGVRASFTIGSKGGTWAIPPKCESVSVLEVLEHVCGDTHEHNKAMQMRIADILTHGLKWAHRRLTVDGVREYRFFRPA